MKTALMLILYLLTCFGVYNGDSAASVVMFLIAIYLNIPSSSEIADEVIKRLKKEKLGNTYHIHDGYFYMTKKEAYDTMKKRGINAKESEEAK